MKILCVKQFENENGYIFSLLERNTIIYIIIKKRKSYLNNLNKYIPDNHI